ncbi:MAG: hypothetical protein P4N60_19150 [Verrucomicrobiae bacterium]|nr:hypothetical protein [Verrucomicrobiae bacterium]
MSVVTTIKLSPEAQKLAASLKTMPARALEVIAAAMYKENTATVTHIQKKYLSYPAAGPTTKLGLRHISGDYAKSLWTPKPVINGQTVQSNIGSPVKSHGVSYPAVHEFGADFPSRPTKSKNKSYAKRHPKTKAWSLPARAPIQKGITDRLPDYGRTISAALIAAIGGDSAKN